MFRHLLLCFVFKSSYLRRIKQLVALSFFQNCAHSETWNIIYTIDKIVTVGTGSIKIMFDLLFCQDKPIVLVTFLVLCEKFVELLQNLINQAVFQTFPQGRLELIVYSRFYCLCLFLRRLFVVNPDIFRRVLVNQIGCELVQDSLTFLPEIGFKIHSELSGSLGHLPANSSF